MNDRCASPEEMMIPTLHAHPLSSYCWKVLIPLHEKGIDFAFNQVELGEAESLAALTRLWPFAKMPVLEHQDRVVAETTIIIEYLDLHFAGRPMIPADREAALETRLLDRIFDQQVMAPMQKIVFNRFCPPEARNAHDVMTARRTIETAYTWLESRLRGREWADGTGFGLADCAAAPSLHYADRVQPMVGRYPVVRSYLDRLEKRPSFARVLEEAAPFAHMFPQEN
jgi:glutathione S-transferase